MFEFWTFHRAEPCVPRWLADDLGLPRETPLKNLGVERGWPARSRPKGVFTVASRNPVVAALEDVPLFAGLPRNRRRRVSHLATIIEFPARSVLAHEGKAPEEFFVVLDGRVQVCQGDTVIATQGPGSHAGGPALLGNRDRATSLVAATPVLTLIAKHREFARLLVEVPEVSERLLADIGRATLSGRPTEYAA